MHMDKTHQISGMGLGWLHYFLLLEIPLKLYCAVHTQKAPRSRKNDLYSH